MSPTDFLSLRPGDKLINTNGLRAIVSTRRGKVLLVTIGKLRASITETTCAPWRKAP